MSPPRPHTSTAAAVASLLPVLAGVGALAWLIVRDMSLTPVWSWITLAVMSLMALVWLAVLMSLLHTMNPEIARECGRAGAIATVATGMLMIVPFAALALIAELQLGWSAAQAFAAAGLMTGAGAVGLDQARLDKTQSN